MHRSTLGLVLSSLLPGIGCGGEDLTLPAAPGVPATITVVKGNGQEGTAGTALPESVVVKVTDNEGNPVANERIVFVLADPSPGALVAPSEVMTGPDGTAAARWVLGGETGIQGLIAMVVGEGALSLEARVVASATLPPLGADRLEMRTQPSGSATAGSIFERQPVVQIRDAGGAEVERAGVPVTVAVASGIGALGGTTTVATDERGRAEFSDLRINGGTGAHVLIFAAAGHTSVLSEPVEIQAAENPPPPPPPPPPGPATPTAEDDEYVINEGSDRTWEFDAPGVLANDQAGSGRTAQLVSDVSNGSLTLRANGSFSYRPGPDYFGTDAFSYRIREGDATSSPARVVITIRPVNDSPRFKLRGGANQTVRRSAGPQRVENFVREIALGPNNGSEDDQTGTFIVRTDNDALFSAAPSISFPGGTLTYTPSGITGRARVTVRLRDSGGTENGGSDTSREQTFTITVRD